MPIQWTSGGTIGPVRELDKSRSTNFDRSSGQGTGTVQFECLQADAAEILTDFLVNNLEWPYATPGNEKLYAVSGGERPGNEAGVTNGEGIDYPYSILTVGYITALAAESGGGTVIYTESMEPALYCSPPQPAGKFTWTSGSSTPIDPEEAPPKQYWMADYVLTKYNMTTEPDYTKMGKVNSGSVTSPTFGSLAAETLLFNPPLCDRTVSFGGSNRYTHVYRWTYFPDGHNKFWNSETGSFEKLYKIGTSTEYKNYASTSFSGIIP